MDCITYKNSAPLGDLFSYLPTIKSLYDKTGRKGLIYQVTNVYGQGYAEEKQPFNNKHGDSIMVPRGTFDMAIPFLKSLDYIENALEYNGEQIEVDFDKMRVETFVNQPLGCINRWPFYLIPDAICDLSEQWISLKKPKNDFFKGKIIVNFTKRYRNNWINYFFLKEYENNVVFAGLPEEYELFCEKWKLTIERLEIKNFLELAEAINSCKIFLGNQSMMFQIAEGLKVNRVLETYMPMPNVIPTGANGYDFYHQKAVESIIKRLYYENRNNS